MVIGRPNVFEETRAQVAQLVEQWTENPRVGGSIPPLGTTFSQGKQRLRERLVMVFFKANMP